MNWGHLQLFVWLRWKLLRNQWRRAGAVNAVLMMIVAISAVITAVPLFIGSFMLGLYLIPKASPAHLMYAWDALIAAFLLFWSIGLITELQRTESLSLSKFLHLPVSVNEAFLINYVSSLLRLSVLCFGPVMLAFCLALIWVQGVWMLPSLALLVAFLLMISALTYQFQGWLATLMSNPRRRRTVVVVTTMAFVLVFQLPNLFNFLTPWGIQSQVDRTQARQKELAKLEVELRAQGLEPAEYSRRQQELTERHMQEMTAENRKSFESLQQMARLANMVVPLGWLPLGIMSAAEQQPLAPFLGFLGMTLIGLGSLGRAYRTTMRQYQGQSSNRQVAPSAKVGKSVDARKPRHILLEAHLPGLGEQVSAIALGGFRSLVRSPEAKMMLLAPVFTIPIMGTMLWRTVRVMPELVRPLIAIGGILFVFLGMIQIAGNMFGFDRDGFRVFVLSAARRRDILLGKNLAMAPVALGLATILVPVVQIIYPMRIDHLLALIPQSLTMFLLFCSVTNLLSIYAPTYIAPGTMKAHNPKVTAVLLQLLMFMFLFPLIQGVTLLPLGIEALLKYLDRTAGLPVFLLLALAECVAVVFLYRVLISWEAGLLQDREQKILEVVTNRAL